MKTHIAYCSACDQDVRVVITDEPSHEGQAPLRDGELVCLDFGSRCTGSMCPMFGLPRVLMGIRLAQSGLRPEAFETITAPCQECGFVGELQLINADTAVCPSCNARTRTIRLNVGDESFIALATAPSS